MSGGSYDYAYVKVGWMADSLLGSKDPLRRAFATHLKLVEKAMQDIEWVDSGDCGHGDETDAIERVLGVNKKALVLDVLKKDAEELIQRLDDAIKS